MAFSGSGMMSASAWKSVSGRFRVFARIPSARKSRHPDFDPAGRDLRLFGEHILVLANAVRLFLFDWRARRNMGGLRLPLELLFRDFAVDDRDRLQNFPEISRRLAFLLRVAIPRRSALARLDGFSQLACGFARVMLRYF